MIKKYLPVSLFFILVLVLGLGYPSLFMTHLVEPAALIIWTLWRMIISVDQQLSWVLLIEICFIFVIRQIPQSNNYSAKPVGGNKENHVNRIAYWQSLISDASLWRSERDYLRDSLRQLLDPVLAETEGLLVEDTEDINIETLKLMPSEIYEIIDKVSNKNPQKSENNQQKQKSYRPKWYLSLTWKINRPNITELDIVLRWMENKLELIDE